MAKTTTNYAFPYPEDADPVDVAGDIQALAEDIDTNLGEIIADTVGTMVTSNTENGITVEYDDNDNTLDFDVADFDVILSGDVSGSATVTNLASINISASVADNSHNHIASNITDFESAVEAVTESFVTIDLPSGTDPVATIYNDTLTISESNGILVSGSGSNTVDISTNATPLNTASALVSRDSERTFDITAVDFDTSASATTQVGRLAWEDGEGTLKVNLKGGNVDLDIGQENVVLTNPDLLRTTFLPAESSTKLAFSSFTVASVGASMDDCSAPLCAAPPIWNVLIVNCVPGSPID